MALEPHEVEQLRRSVAMLQPGCPTALDRETASSILGQLADLQRRYADLDAGVRGAVGELVRTLRELLGQDGSDQR